VVEEVLLEEVETMTRSGREEILGERWRSLRCYDVLAGCVDDQPTEDVVFFCFSYSPMYYYNMSTDLF